MQNEDQLQPKVQGEDHLNNGSFPTSVAQDRRLFEDQELISPVAEDKGMTIDELNPRVLAINDMNAQDEIPFKQPSSFEIITPKSTAKRVSKTKKSKSSNVARKGRISVAQM